MDNQKKVLKLLDYIRKVVSLRQKLVRSIKDEEWTLYLDELPVDPKRIRVQPEGAGEDVLLEVEKPEFIACPELPFDLLGWIRTPNWRDFAVTDIEVREERLRHDDRLGDVTERFVDSGVRLAAMMPATCATVSTSPFFTPPERMSEKVSSFTSTRPAAVAVRWVGAFSPTSTMRARP